MFLKMDGHMLYTYLLTHDHGFAPNPFHGTLTLATCKPGMRRVREKDEWIAGFVSKKLTDLAKGNGLDVELGGIVYLAKITNKVSLDQYFKDLKFECKKPTEPFDQWHIDALGDNIYEEISKEQWKQHKNAYHEDDDYTKKHDAGGKCVLISNEFYYLGRQACKPQDKDGWAKFKINIPNGKPTAYGYRSPDFDDAQLDALRKWLELKGFKLNAVSDLPCLAPRNATMQASLVGRRDSGCGKGK